MTFSARLSALSTIVLALFSAGCCLSVEEANARRKNLLERNRAAAEPAMRAAAAARGAVLLPQLATEMLEGWPCASGSDEAEPRPAVPVPDHCSMNKDIRGGCDDWAADKRTFLIRHKGAKPKLAIVYNAGWADYARLARRGKKLFILAPRPTARDIGRATQCFCEGGPELYCPRGWIFILDEPFSPVEIEDVDVPMIEDRLEWKCKETAV
jgi:hypothetical protein